MPLKSILAAVVMFLAASASVAQVAPTPPSAESQTLSRVIRDLLLAHLPDPVVESAPRWGQQKEFTVGLTWRRVGAIRAVAEPRKGLRNDGHWERVRIQGINPRESLAVGVRDIRQAGPGKTTFESLIGLNVRMTYEQQLWKSGVRLYSGETRARCRAAVRLVCEVASRTEKQSGAILPDVVLRVRVTDAEVFYQDLVCEHTAGVGGEAAQVIGETAHKLLRRVKPGIERDLLARANAAVVRAADTKEVRLELNKLLVGGVSKVSRTPSRP